MQTCFREKYYKLGNISLKFSAKFSTKTKIHHQLNIDLTVKFHIFHAKFNYFLCCMNNNLSRNLLTQNLFLLY